MSHTDTWGKDPDVRRARDFFSKMESLDRQFISDHKISLFDPKLRPARDMRRRSFEAACARAVKQGVTLDEQICQTMFCLCQHLSFKKFDLVEDPLLNADHPHLLDLVMEDFK